MSSTVEICRVAVLGAGTMSADIAAIFLARGVNVDLVGRPGRSLDSVKERVSHALRQLSAKPGDARLQISTELRTLPWSDIGLVVESISEDLAAKRQIFAELVRLTPAITPLTSNSSGFPISAIGAGLPTQERMLGLHFFMPAHLVPLVEVVCSDASDRAIAQRVYDFMTAVECVPVLVKKDVPGFLANRIQHALMREVWSLLDRGVASPEDIDKAVRYGFGMRYLAAGPVLQKEHSGLEVNLAASTYIYPHLCNDAGPPPTLREKVRRGEIGMKAGKGFWTWSPESIAAEKARYDRVLLQALRILRDDEPHEA
jgi:3-hydroxybutyryl-CoA dehydrogenase